VYLCVCADKFCLVTKCVLIPLFFSLPPYVSPPFPPPPPPRARIPHDTSESEGSGVVMLNKASCGEGEARAYAVVPLETCVLDCRVSIHVCWYAYMCMCDACVCTCVLTRVCTHVHVYVTTFVYLVMIVDRECLLFFPPINVIAATTSVPE
jgi:hypothetical protein